MRLDDDVAVADFGVFFRLGEVGVVAPGVFGERRPRLDRHLTVGFRRERHHRVAGVYRGVDTRQPLAGARFADGAVQFAEHFYFAFGVPVDAFAAVAEFAHQRAKRGVFFEGVRVVAYHGDKGRRGFAGNQLAFAAFPVFDVKGLRHFRRAVVLHWQGYHVGFFAEVAHGEFGEFGGDALVDVPVATRFPAGVNRLREGVDEGVHVRGVDVFFPSAARCRSKRRWCSCGSRGW